MEMQTPGPASGPSSQPAATSGGRQGAVGTKPNGPVAAVMIATGLGTLVLGILTTLGEASEGVAEFLEFSERVGPLSGKTIFAVIAFLVSWGGLHMALRDREVDWRSVTIALVALVAVSLVLTFPPFFQLFESD
jgi:hypothetical protein